MKAVCAAIAILCFCLILMGRQMERLAAEIQKLRTDHRKTQEFDGIAIHGFNQQIRDLKMWDDELLKEQKRIRKQTDGLSKALEAHLDKWHAPPPEPDLKMDVFGDAINEGVL